MIHSGPAPQDGSSASRLKSHFLESVILTWAGNLGRIVIGLVALRLVTGVIPEAELGAYWILTSLAALLSNFADLGIGLAVARHLPLAPSPDSARRLMHTVLAIRLAALLFLCVLIAVARPWILRLFDADSIAAHYGYVYVFVVVTNLNDLYIGFLQGLNRFRAIAVFALLSSVTRLMLILILVKGLGFLVAGLFVSEALSLLLAVVLSAWSCSHGLRPRFHREQALIQLRFGFPLYLNTLLSYSATRLNTLMIARMIGPVAVSLFSVAARVPDQLSMVLRSYTQVYLPNMSRFLAARDEERARRLLTASLRLMGFCFAMLTMALGFFRHELMALLAPPAYQQAAVAIPLLVGALIFAALGSILGHTLVAMGDSRTPLWINIWTTLVSLALNLVLIRVWGFLGAALASLLFNLVGYIVTDVVVSRRLPPSGRGYLALLAFLCLLVLLGLNASLFYRLVLLVVSVPGSLLLFPSLRHDLVEIWTTLRRSSVSH